MGEQQHQHLYEFGPFSLDTRERVLLRDGRPLLLKPKVYETLVVLVSQSGHVVEKEELMRRIWPDVVVEENNLTGNIFALRRAFAEYDCIETIPRRGYRFTGDVKQVRVADVKVTDRFGVETEVLIKESVSTRKHGIDSLAVLPFINASADPEADYLSDGITESIINNLSRLSPLRVMARSTVFRYKGREYDPQEVGLELGVGVVLLGRLLQLGDHLIVRAELVDVRDGAQLWGAQYSRTPSDILQLQEEIANEISEALQLKLTAEEKEWLTKRYTDNTEAYHAYLKGRYFFYKRTPEGLRKGIEYFQKAIELDPTYALAYSGLADCYAVLGWLGESPPNESCPKAKAAALKALEIDDTIAEAHTSLAFVRTYYDLGWTAGETEFRRAIELRPGYALAHHWYGFQLLALGRFDESIAEMRRVSGT
ncbi:MAG: winged helix-turn-helix domain-containing protein [Pyrinomonadaceae bacterium]|nr:winged helix-turn-helix domain-containing protein [Pyrinomonadaceae bacterium]